jgi:hypothetical protein
MKCQRCKGRGVVEHGIDDDGLRITERCPVCRGWGETGPWNKERPKSAVDKLRAQQQTEIPGAERRPTTEPKLRDK